MSILRTNLKNILIIMSKCTEKKKLMMRNSHNDLISHKYENDEKVFNCYVILGHYYGKVSYNNENLSLNE